MAYDPEQRGPRTGGALPEAPDINRERRERAAHGPYTGRDTPGAGRPEQHDRSFVALLRDLRDESISLIQNEIDLARTEIQNKLTEARDGAISAAIGAAVLGAGLLMLLFAATAGLYAGMVALEVSNMVAGWLSPLIVGGVVAIIGTALMAAGKKKMEPSNLRPTRTERSLRETGAWAERKM